MVIDPAATVHVIHGTKTSRVFPTILTLYGMRVEASPSLINFSCEQNHHNMVTGKPNHVPLLVLLIHFHGQSYVD